MELKTLKLDRELWEQIAIEDNIKTYAEVDDHLYVTYGLRCVFNFTYDVFDEDKFTLFKLKWL